jgi:predicted small metal-binding protein
MQQVVAHVKQKHRVQTTTDTIANYVKKAVRRT